jgi:hypothetical protein
MDVRIVLREQWLWNPISDMNEIRTQNVWLVAVASYNDIRLLITRVLR